MNNADHDMIGHPVEKVAAAAARPPSHSREEVAAALDPLVEGGVVTEAAIDATVSDTSKLLATAATRVELAEQAVNDAARAAEDVPDVDTVGSQLDAFAARRAAVSERLDSLEAQLPTGIDEGAAPEAIYEFAVTVRDVASRAQGVIQTADELATDAERFESWLSTPARRHEAFSEDLELVSESVTDLETAVTELSAVDQPAVQWADATLRVHVTRLLVTDLAAELADLRILAEDSTTVPEELGERVDTLEDRVETLSEDLAAQATEEWRSRYGDKIAELEAELASIEPPVDWGELQERLEAHRQAAFD